MHESISFHLENEKLLFADLLNRDELKLILICESGNVYLYNLSDDSKRLILNHFPLLAYPLKIYSFENYVCFTEQTRSNGLVIETDKGYQKILKRDDYSVKYTYWSIAFFKRNDQTFLIHGTDWNRLDITCLETDKLLTDRIVDYDTKTNYLDYFHSSLLVSPDFKHFTSNGWIWHPYGEITIYSVEDFLKNFENSHKLVRITDNFYDLESDRPLCWIDDQTLGIGFNQKIADADKKEYPSEIIFYDIVKNEILKRIEFNGFSLSYDGDVSGELYFQADKQVFIGLNTKSGILISDINGKELARNSNFNSYKYSPKHKLFYQLNYKDRLFEFGRLENI
jgi:hypothetical protein